MYKSEISIINLFERFLNNQNQNSQLLLKFEGMNKQNSMAIDNELSTEINESTKSYSSRFKQLKAIKSNNKCRYSDVLPFRLEKAAVVIQKFWRLRQVLKKKLYEQLMQELDDANCILQFQNSSMDNLIEIYEKDCNQLEEYFQERGKFAVEKEQKEANISIKQMAILTFKMQKRIISDAQVNQLVEQLQQLKERNTLLQRERQELKGKLCGELQEEQESFLKKIKDENLNLLRVSKQKHEAEKMMREKLIQTCKMQLQL